MNVVIFGKGLGKPRQMNLSGLTAGLLAIAVGGVVTVLGFAGGYCTRPRPDRASARMNS